MIKNVNVDVRSELWSNKRTSKIAAIPVSEFEGTEVVIISLDLMADLLGQLGFEKE